MLYFESLLTINHLLFNILHMSAEILDPSSLSPRQLYARHIAEIRIGLTPDDVLLVPRAAPIPGVAEEWGPGFTRIVIPDEAFNDPDFEERDLSSRMNTDVSTFIDQDGKIRLAIPIVSSPMIDVTKSGLAIPLTQQGGMGFIHRGLIVAEQAAEVKRTKNAMSYIFTEVPTLPPSATVFDARQEMEKSERSLVVITDEGKHVTGVITRRDVKKGWVEDDKPLSYVLENKPMQGVISVTQQVDIDPSTGDIFVRPHPDEKPIKATDFMWQNRIEKLIVVDDEGRLIGAIVDFDIRLRKDFPNATIDEKGRLRVGAAFGIKNYMKRVEALVDAGVDMLCLDTANAYQRQALDAVSAISKRYPDVPILAGSIATRQGVRMLKDAGAKSIRNNIGSGSTCLTRGVSGFGVPSLTSTLEVADEADKFGIPVIADGGIEYSSDLAKLFAAGARAAMLGKKLAAAEESSAEIYVDPETGNRYKLYYGMASERNRKILQIAEGLTPTEFTRKQEGAPIMLGIKGDVAYIVGDLVAGLRSGLTYGGVLTLEQLRNEVDFIRITQSGYVESGIRGDRF